MEQTTITVKYHNTTKWDNPNEERPKNFQVVAEDGSKYSYDKTRANNWKFAEGETKTIFFEEQPGINGGKPWNLITDVILEPPTNSSEDIPFDPYTNGSGNTQPQTSYQNDQILNEIHGLYKKCFQLVSTEDDFQDFSMEQKGTTATTYFIAASRSK